MTFSSETGRAPVKLKSLRVPVVIIHRTLYRKSDLCIPRNETAWPRSQCLHSCIREQFIYSQERSGSIKIGRPILGKYKSLTNTWMWKLGDRTLWICSGNNETARSFISGNTWIRDKYFYWTLTGPSFAVRVCAVQVGTQPRSGMHRPRHGNTRDELSKENVMASLPNSTFKCLSRGKGSVSVFERPLNRAKSPPFWNRPLKI